MIYIGTTGNNGSAIYLDIYLAERQGRGMRISGTIGDGCYEGEVLVEVGRTDCVTFADAWLGGSGFTEFLSRCGSDVLEKALLETVREMPLYHPKRILPHGNSKALAEIFATEPSLTWRYGS
jgi:hypothetical protein